MALVTIWSLLLLVASETECRDCHRDQLGDRPLVQLIVMSFQKFGREQIFGKPPLFVGLENYAFALTSPEEVRAATSIIITIFFITPPVNIVALPAEA